MRTRKLVRPRLQLRITLWFVSIAACTLVLQFVVLTSVFSDIAMSLTQDAAKNFDLLASGYTRVLLMSVAVVLPITAIVGILSTFRIAGPLHRIESFLIQVRNGSRPADCQTRKGDELGDLCDLVNDVTADQRRPSADKTVSRDAA